MCGQHWSHTIDFSGNCARGEPDRDPHTTQLQPPLIARSISRSLLTVVTAGTCSASTVSGP